MLTEKEVSRIGGMDAVGLRDSDVYDNVVR